MSTKNFRGLSFAAAIAAALILMGPVASPAGEQGEKPQEGHPGTGDPAMMEEGMMAMHEKMHAKMQAMDQRLDALVAEMESAGKKQKADAVAAVVIELVNQRKGMHAMMMKAQPRMMGHMMEHMRSGMMAGMKSGMKQSMADCPMMKQMASGGQEKPEDHSEHHPEE